MLAFTSSLFKNEIYSGVLEVNDTEIFGVNVRIYRYGNKTNQDGKDGKQDLLPAMIYFHGGGWTFGSLGKLLFYKNIFANSELDGCIKYCSSKHSAIQINLERLDTCEKMVCRGVKLVLSWQNVSVALTRLLVLLTKLLSQFETLATIYNNKKGKYLSVILCTLAFSFVCKIRR